MFSSQRQICFTMVFLVTTSFAILNVSADIERQAHSTELYGETDAEGLGELSILDVLLRKRREGCDNNVHEQVDEVFYDKVEDDLIAGNETEISVEQAEIVSYEDIVNGGEGVETNNTSPMADFLTPPAENANCTNYVGDHDETKTADAAENTEKTLTVDAASGTVLVA